MNQNNTKIIFTPDNEPYLGRKLLFHFDQIIISTMELNTKKAQLSQTINLNDHQKMASQIISQTLSLILSTRELIRQGFLFSGYVLLRSIIERITIILYLTIFPEKINIWNDGWNVKDTPNLSTMIDKIQSKWKNGPEIGGKEYTTILDSLIHGKPDSYFYNLTFIKPNEIGLSPSKNIDRPDLCDSLCADLISWTAIIQAMMNYYFED